MPRSELTCRTARPEDVQAVASLIASAAEQGAVLPRSSDEIQDCISGFFVAEKQGRVVGCVGLRNYEDGLFEVRSLVVDEDLRDQGVGTCLVQYAVNQAAARGVKTLFTLTRRATFFEQLGFRRVPKGMFPKKVWTDCRNCPKRDHCDETALVYDNVDANQSERAC